MRRSKSMQSIHGNYDFNDNSNNDDSLIYEYDDIDDD